MTKQLNLTLEEAIKFYNNSNDNGSKELLENNFGKDFWKPKDITNIVHNLETLIKHLGYNPLIYPNPSNSFEKYINACSVLTKVVEIYNENAKLDWKNKEGKWYPYKYFFAGGGFAVDFGWHCSSLICSGRLYLKSETIAKKAYNNFKEFYEDYWSI